MRRDAIPRRYLMMVSELLPQLAALPPDTELLVEIGGEKPNSVAVAGLDYPNAEGHHVCFQLDPDDLPDALRDLRIHAKMALAATAALQTTPLRSLAWSRLKARWVRSRDGRQVYTLR
jgi:hypothetical protein